MSIINSHKDRLIKFLKRDSGGMNLSNSQIKDFSEQLRVLGIIDMSKTSTQEWLITDSLGQSTLITLGTWFSLGLMSKMAEIKAIAEGK